MTKGSMPLLRPILLLSGCGFFLVGCASTQLNFNTLDLASTVDSLIVHQILYNLDRFQVDPYSIPTQVTISAGTVTTSNSITPTVAAPLNVAETTTNILAKVLGGATTTTTQVASARSNSSLSLAASDGWNQQWAILPVTDADQIRKLRILYQFATGNASRNELLCNYPISRKAASSSSSLGGGGGAKKSSAPPNSGASKSKNTITYTGPDGSTITATLGGEGESGKKGYLVFCDKEKKLLPAITDADESFLSPPNCVICYDQSRRYLEEHDNDGCDYGPKEANRYCLHVNPRLKTGVAGKPDEENDAWLHFSDRIGELPANAIIVGQIGNRTAYVLGRDQRENFAEFVLFTLEALQQTSTSSTTAILVPPVVVPQ